MDEATHQDPKEQPPRQQTEHGERGPSHRHMRDHYRHQRPRPAVEQRPPAEGAAGTDPDAEDDEEEERRTDAQSSRHSHGGGRGHRGRPPKKVYEEFINDPYCE